MFLFHSYTDDGLMLSSKTFALYKCINEIYNNCICCTILLSNVKAPLRLNGFSGSDRINLSYEVKTALVSVVTKLLKLDNWKLTYPRELDFSGTNVVAVTFSKFPEASRSSH